MQTRADGGFTADSARLARRFRLLGAGEFFANPLGSEVGAGLSKFLLSKYFSTSYVTERLYTRADSGGLVCSSDQSLLNLVGRLFGLASLLAGSIRFACGRDTSNRTLFQLCLASMVVAVLHILVSWCEIFQVSSVCLSLKRINDRCEDFGVGPIITKCVAFLSFGSGCGKNGLWVGEEPSLENGAKKGGRW